MDQAVKERAGGDDDGLGADGAAVAEFDAEDFLTVLSSQFSVLSLVVGRWPSIVGFCRALLGWTAEGGRPRVAGAVLQN